ncbi:MAG: AMP-binding protein, partial [Thermoleophilaceae bacterium]
AQNLGVDPADRWLCPLPLHHVGGLAVLLRSAIYATTALVHERFDAGGAKDCLEAGEATLASLVPTMLARLREDGLAGAPRLRAILLGGGPAPRELVDWAEAAGLPVRLTYGMTETASQVATADPGERAGTPLPGVELRIGPRGEILVRGPMVAPGAPSGDGWLHTGDRGRLDEAGKLHVDGRLGNVIVTGGENVAAEEVEEALLAHPAVDDAAVVGLPDPEWGEAVSAFVVLGRPASADELIAWCRERLAPHKLPKRVEQVPGLPRSPAGKLLRDELLPPSRASSRPGSRRQESS